MRDVKGFTLVELMIVVAVVSILFTLVFPNMSRLMARSRLKDAARDVYFDMQSVRMRSIKEGREFAIQFDTTANAYKVIRDRGVDGKWNTDDDEVVKTVNLTAMFSDVTFGSNAGARPGATSTNTVITFPSKRVEFNPSGANTSAPTSSSGTVYLRNDRETFAIGTVSASGRVRIWRNYTNDDTQWDPPAS